MGSVALADDDMVAEIDLEIGERGGEGAGDLDILGAGLGVAAGVVVADDGLDGVVDEAKAEHVAGGDEGAVDGAEVDEVEAERLALGVEREQDEGFPLGDDIGEDSVEVGGGFARAGDSGVGAAIADEGEGFRPE